MQSITRRIVSAAGVTAAVFNLLLYITGMADFLALALGCVALFIGLVMR